MLESYLIFLLLFTVAVIGATIPFFAIALIRFVKRQTFEYGRQMGVISQNLNDVKRIVAYPMEKYTVLEQRCKRLTERLEQMELRDQGCRQYEQAVKLIKKGLSIEDVMLHCQLNRGEVELISSMHNNIEELNSQIGR